MITKDKEILLEIENEIRNHFNKELEYNNLTLHNMLKQLKIKFKKQNIDFDVKDMKPFFKNENRSTLTYNMFLYMFLYKKHFKNKIKKLTESV